MIYLKFFWALLRHKYYVIVAGLHIGVPFLRLLAHDWQKFTPSEFGCYARYIKGEKTDKTANDFMYAWLHHVHRGPHHWEHWLLHPNYNFSTAKNGAIPMPEKYVLEMVADWLGSSMAYQGSWNMSVWMSEHGPQMTLHEDTKGILDKILFQQLGYFISDNCPWSYMTLDEWSTGRNL